MPPAISSKPRLEKTDYTAEELEKLAGGEVSLKELSGVTDAEVLKIAETGYSMFQSGRFKEARVIFTGLIALAPDVSYFRTLLGCVHLAESNPEQALTLFDEALLLNPNDTVALVHRGEMYILSGKIDEGAQDIAAVVRLDPEGKSPATYRARAVAAAALEMLKESQQLQKEDTSKLAPGAAKSSGPAKKK
ncbi:MAG TPA: type III secretion protein [Myxococcaceae bacterium]|nr:type III secretion protein [Myxococcaceae bacterium]